MTLIKKTQGFSLIEVMIASGLFALTFTAGLKLYQQIYGQWQQLNAVQQARQQLEADQTTLLINVNANQDKYATIPPSSTTSGLKAVTLEQVVEPLPQLNHPDEALRADETLSEESGLTTEEKISEEEALDEAQELNEKVKPESQAITQQLKVVVASPYQSRWQDIAIIGPLIPLPPATP
jgi:prepilin-type N-terminal cleavage/methylation domain-containing protein